MTAGLPPFRVTTIRQEIRIVGSAGRGLSLDTDPARTGVSNVILIEKGMRVNEPQPSHRQGSTHLDDCPALCRNGSCKVDAPTSGMCHYLLGRR